jgi:hypothetical protein
MMRLIARAAVASIVIAASAQRAFAEDPLRKYPSFPGAVTKAPPWLGKALPFDMASFFVEIPSRQNAAPPYLDALFEFGTDMAICFPTGPEMSARYTVARARSQRLQVVYDVFVKDRASVDRAALRAVLENYQAGFQKLEQAQKRPHCVFETGFSFMTLVPHVQVCRDVPRVASLRTLSNIERGDLTAVVDDVALVLRMVRDIQPRGHAIAQLVYAAIVNVTAKDMAVPVLYSYCQAL